MSEIGWLKWSVMFVLFGGGGWMFAWSMRYIIHFYVFPDMSGGQKRLVIQRQPFWKKILMTYAFKSAHPILTWWCLLCYYAFCISVLTFLILLILMPFVEIEYSGVPTVLIILLAPLLCYLSLGFYRK